MIKDNKGYNKKSLNDVINEVSHSLLFKVVLFGSVIGVGAGLLVDYQSYKPNKNDDNYINVKYENKINSQELTAPYSSYMNNLPINKPLEIKLGNEDYRIRVGRELNSVIIDLNGREKTLHLESQIKSIEALSPNSNQQSKYNNKTYIDLIIETYGTKDDNFSVYRISQNK
ncbi:MAG: hypothetical protein GWP09_00355 [Nitrospiraceae bacterium]|nr:hypothetical protein [Nitrospiraceae bacterium]